MTKGKHRITLELSSDKQIAHLQHLAARLGFQQSRGPGRASGQGSASALIDALASVAATDLEGLTQVLAPLFTEINPSGEDIS